MSSQPTSSNISRSTEGGAEAVSLTLLTFVKDDREALRRLVPRLDEALSGAGLRARLLVVDDGSAEPLDRLELDAPPTAIERIDALVLARNLGHQRAIAVGLSHLCATGAEGLVVVLDADGEDRPEDVPTLVAAARDAPGRLVFAARSRRVEGPAFQIGYRCYQVLHWLLTGRGIRVGNFSCVPASKLRAIASHPDLWNHYAASVFTSRMPTTLVACPRGHRLAGRSRLNLVALVVHGLSAIACYREQVVVRLAAVMAAVLAVSVAALVALAVAAFTAPDAANVGVLLGAGFVALVSLQVLAACGLAALVLLSQRSVASALPLRDHEAFIDRLVTLHA